MGRLFVLQVIGYTGLWIQSPVLPCNRKQSLDGDPQGRSAP